MVFRNYHNQYLFRVIKWTLKVNDAHKEKPSHHISIYFVQHHAMSFEVV